MNMFVTSVICVIVGWSVLSLAIDQTESTPLQASVTAEAQCSTNCQGDFPVSSTRKYAQAHEGHHWTRV